MPSLAKFTTVLLSVGFLMGCTVPPDAPTPTSDPVAPTDTEPSSVMPQPDPTDGEFEPLPDAIAADVKAALSEEIGDIPLEIRRYSRETWSDGCLGLGGPAESCLAEETEGWQVEVIDGTDQSYFFRTNLAGDQIRRSTLEHNLPPSVSDRIFQTIVEDGLTDDLEALSVVSAEPRLWDGCYGLPPEATGNNACPEVGIFGWQAVISDGDQSWVYHTDNGGTEIRLNPNG